MGVSGVGGGLGELFAIGLQRRIDSDYAGLWAPRKGIGIYHESQVESSQGTGLCLNLPLREFRQKKKSLNIENIQHNYYGLC